MEKLSDWYRISEDLKKLRSTEKKLRIEVFKDCFPDPVEGSSVLNLRNNYKLKCNYKINRSINVDIMDTLDENLCSGLINTNVSLNLSAYRRLSVTDRHIVDNALILKPGFPSLEIISTTKG